MAATKLASNIKFLRKRQKLSQDALAQILGVKRSNITAYEIKGIEPRLRIIAMIAELFDISIRSLVSEELIEGVEYPKFCKLPETMEESDNQLAVGETVVHKFSQDTEKLIQILNGFRSLSEFRAEDFQDLSSEDRKLLTDIDSFTKISQNLLRKNLEFINLLKSQG